MGRTSISVSDETAELLREYKSGSWDEFMTELVQSYDSSGEVPVQDLEVQLKNSHRREIAREVSQAVIDDAKGPIAREVVEHLR